MKYTIETANALLDRMAFGTPFHHGYCGACPCKTKGVHGTKGFLTGKDYGPCPLLPIVGHVPDVDAALRGKLARIEFSGAGICLACHAMLDHNKRQWTASEVRAAHLPGCELAAILGPVKA